MSNQEHYYPEHDLKAAEGYQWQLPGKPPIEILEMSKEDLIMALVGAIDVIEELDIAATRSKSIINQWRYGETRHDAN